MLSYSDRGDEDDDDDDDVMEVITEGKNIIRSQRKNRQWLETLRSSGPVFSVKLYYPVISPGSEPSSYYFRHENRIIRKIWRWFSYLVTISSKHLFSVIKRFSSFFLLSTANYIKILQIFNTKILKTNVKTLFEDTICHVF